MPPPPRKRLKESFFTPRSAKPKPVGVKEYKEKEGDDDLDTDTKLAILSALYPSVAQSTLLDLLVSTDGSISKTSDLLKIPNAPRKTSGGRQSSLTSFLSTPSIPKLPPNGQTLHLYSPLHISTLTPCTLHPTFLPPALATALFTELLQESTTFPPPSQFTLFSRTVTSPHTTAFFTPTPTLTPYYYQGKTLPRPRAFTESMTAASSLIQSHLRTTVPGWTATAAFVNAYAGASQGVGYHSDALTYLGPRATIATLSLGAQREFRIKPHPPSPTTHPHTYAIHLPHNSLLAMTAGVQEAWKHSVPLVRSVDAHPLAGTVRIAVTWRWYRDGFAPEKIPRCRCGVGMMLKPVFSNEEGGDGGDGRRYYWACEGGYRGEGEGCGEFRWAEFDEDGNILHEKDQDEAGRSDVRAGVA